MLGHKWQCLGVKTLINLWNEPFSFRHQCPKEIADTLIHYRRTLLVVPDTFLLILRICRVNVVKIKAKMISGSLMDRVVV